MPKNILNTYFNKIFVISLYDNETRWKQVNKQFSCKGIKAERFIAVDGRCKKGEVDCLDKLNTFELSYNVKIKPKKGQQLSKVLPAASLTIGTILLLRAMVKNKWKRMLICEDDIILEKKFVDKFTTGIKEIGNRRWDVLYLGCGSECGVVGISDTKNRKHKHTSPWNDNGAIEDEFYVNQRNDLRTHCNDCIRMSEHITKAYAAGGTWCYAYSLAGAKKVLKLINDDANNHIDQLLIKMMKADKITALSFDPPVVMHEDLRKGRVTDIPW